MTTNRGMELLSAAFYPKAMKHLQQLIMDAESCAAAVGERTWFGKDKFPPKLEAFERTLVACAIALEEDQQLEDSRNPQLALEAIDKAMGMLQATYSSWPAAFEFWRLYYDGATE